MLKNICFIVTVVLLAAIPVKAQYIDSVNYIGQDIRSIWTAVPFLVIAPDSRASAMGDAGVATTPDANSMHWNPAKYAFIQNNAGVAISYTPWLRKLVDDINLGYLAGYYRLDENQVVAGSLLYFDLGSIQFTDQTGNPLINFNPREFSVDLAYSRKFYDNISGSLAGRFINSNLTGGINNENARPGRTFAMDVGVFYTDKMKINGKESNLSFGLLFSNVGSKIKYTEDKKYFLPINLRLGSALKMELDKYNSLMVTADLNKLLVPSPPVRDAANDSIVKGRDPNVSVPAGMFQSFYDAPYGFEEELKEIMISVGAEYWYAKQFAIRAGYFYENRIKGNRKYFTAGLGLKLNVFGLDFSYLVPTNNLAQNPLAETLRFTILFDLDAVGNKQ